MTKRFGMSLGFEIVCNVMSINHVMKFCAHHDCRKMPSYSTQQFLDKYPKLAFKANK